AFHCLDVPFFFDVLSAPGVAAVAGPNPPQELADEVHGAAVEFVTTHRLPFPTWPTARVFDNPAGLAAHAYAEVAPLG
ncbi:hypothetical protein SB769_38180, partial [Burkholderia sp. SIMBA_024]